MSVNQIYGAGQQAQFAMAQGRIQEKEIAMQQQLALGDFTSITKESREGALRRALEEQACVLKDLSEVTSMFLASVSPILSPVAENVASDPRPNTPAHSEIENFVRNNTLMAVELAQRLRVAIRHVAI